MANITENPDYRLVMTFLQNIRPGDMDQESSEQLMMIGQRIKAGGALTDREREMFEAVVSNMPSYAPANNLGSMSEGEARLPMDQVSMGGTSEGEMNLAMQNQMPSQDGATRIKPEDEDYYSRLINMYRSGEISASEMKLAMDTAMPSNLSPEDMDRFMAQKNAAMNQMPSQDGETYGPSSGVTVAPSNVMSMDDAIAAGLVNPTRPQARPAPMRPQARPMR